MSSINLLRYQTNLCGKENFNKHKNYSFINRRTKMLYYHVTYSCGGFMNDFDCYARLFSLMKNNFVKSTSKASALRSINADELGN